MAAQFDKDVERLLIAVAELGASASAKEGWVPWSRIAKTLEGAEAFSQIFKAIADLPEAKQLFWKNEKAVKLTSEGWIAFRTLQRPQPGTELLTSQIARAVKEYASNLEPIRFRVNSVGVGSRIRNRTVQPLEIDSEETFATDTPVIFRSTSGWKSIGKVVGQEADTMAVYIAFESELFPDCLPGFLELDRAFLLHSLATRLASLNAVPPLAAEFLQYTNSVTTAMLGQDDARRVADQLAGLPVPWARFLWGPPGAGKTYGLGRLIFRLLLSSPSEQHLIVAPSNRAVDVALLEFLKHCQGVKYLEDLIANRRVLRFGYPRMPEVMERPELLGPASLDNLSQVARDLSRRIRTAERSNEPEDTIATMRAELLSVQDELRNTVHTHIRQSSVVFTTSTLAYLGSDINPISDMPWSSVLVDEATMVPPAQCVFLATLASKRFLLGGDPRQLGPIYESQFGSPNTLEWMGKDVFEKSGISSGQGEARSINNKHDSRLTRIDAQRRCCKEIWSRVQSLYPHVVSAVNEGSLKRLIDLSPKPGQSIIVLDTSALAAQGNARCEKAHGSWRNVASAELAMEVACSAIGDADSDLSIAIISPYRAQVRLLRNWIRQESRSENPAYRQIEAGTVHQFQGSDADFVIFDMVDGFGRPSLGNLLRDDTGLRLTTVAITRARAKVVIIADRKWYQNAAKREHNPLLWDLIVGSGSEHMSVYPSAPDNYRGQEVESPIEQALREAMYEHEVLNDVVREFRILDEHGSIITRADFAFPKLKYAIYCDGAQWHLKHDRWQKDWRQRNKLTELGWTFSVFTGAAIKQNSTLCAIQVARTCQNKIDAAFSK